MAIDGHCCPAVALSPSSLYKSGARAPASPLSSLALAPLRSSPRAAPPPPEPQGVSPVLSPICRLEASPERAAAALSFALPSRARSTPFRHRRTAGAPQPLGARSAASKLRRRRHLLDSGRLAFFSPCGESFIVTPPSSPLLVPRVSRGPRTPQHLPAARRSCAVCPAGRCAPAVARTTSLSS
jgi:hypothetical protein